MAAAAAAAVAVPLAVGLVAWKSFGMPWPQVVELTKYTAMFSGCCVYTAIVVVPLFPGLARWLGIATTHPRGSDERERAIDDLANGWERIVTAFMLVGLLIASQSLFVLAVMWAGELARFAANAYYSRRM